jgi:beta-glucosidase
MSVPISKKIALTGGAGFWFTTAVEEAGLPSIMLTDGPHGVRRQVGSSDHVGLGEAAPATCFPPAVALSSTWSRKTLEEVGEALGDEAHALGVGILLGPGANIKRSPLCGRNFEYFSEDPYVTGELAGAFVKGVQSKGVGTSLKHFAANNQETDRMRRSSEVDERTLREIYLRGFGKVVKSAQPWTVMCSYNKVNGVPAAENRFLLTDILRDEWGFAGFVVSDWGAVHDRVKALKAGLDLQMPADGGVGDAAVANALEAADIDEATIDRAYGRIQRVLSRATAHADADRTTGWDVDAHHALARRVAEQCIVLLKNDGVLPLARDAKLAVVGEFARTPRYQGAGSSRVNPTRLDNALDAITALVGDEVPFAPGFATDPQEPVAIAREADVVIAFLGLGENHESEGYDRTTLDLPLEQLTLLEDILEVNQNVVVVLSNGSSVLVSPFADRVPAIVEGWLLGQAGGPAMADVLFGVVNPSGKLTETIPARPQDVPSYLHFPGDASGVRYGEGLFVGYRGYDAAATEVSYPFGHGLSYTTFAYSDLTVTATATGIDVTVTVTNTGQRMGREIVQAYVSIADSAVVRVPRELKGFADITLDPGRSGTVAITIEADDLAYWSPIHRRWVVEGGAYTVHVGASSRDLRLAGVVELPGNEPTAPATPQTTLGELMKAPQAAMVFQAALAGLFGDASDDPETRRIMADMPIATIAGFVGLQPQQLDDLLADANRAMGL